MQEDIKNIFGMNLCLEIVAWNNPEEVSKSTLVTEKKIAFSSSRLGENIYKKMMRKNMREKIRAKMMTMMMING